jgi:hypothetical protein
MASDFIPSREADLVTWVSDFSSKISAAPTSYSLLAADATALAGLVTSFINLREIAQDPATKTAVATTNKAVAKAALLADVRSLAKRIQAAPSVTAGQKVGLGLPIHNATPTPTPPPETRPIASVAGIDSRMIALRLADETTPTKRARPANATAAEVYSFVATGSEQPPQDLEMWRFEGLATKSDFIVDFNQADAGKNATIVARWVNRKGAAGPTSSPITRAVAA